MGRRKQSWESSPVDSLSLGCSAKEGGFISLGFGEHPCSREELAWVACSWMEGVPPGSRSWARLGLEPLGSFLGFTKIPIRQKKTLKGFEAWGDRGVAVRQPAGPEPESRASHPALALSYTFKRISNG